MWARPARLYILAPSGMVPDRGAFWVGYVSWLLTRAVVLGPPRYSRESGTVHLAPFARQLAPFGCAASALNAHPVAACPLKAVLGASH